MIPFLLIVGIGAGVVGLVVMVQRAEKARTEALRAAAARLGWGFRDAVPFDTIPDLDRFELFKQGHSRKLTNLMTSPAGAARAVLFEYTYTIGGGKSQSTHRQTVFYGVSDALDLPSFSVRPQHFGHSIAKAFGYQDIDLEQRPVFSDMFLLRGTDEMRVREVFGAAAVAEFFEARPDVCAAGVAREVLLWRAGRRVAQDEIEKLMDDGFAAVGSFGVGGRANSAETETS